MARRKSTAEPLPTPAELRIIGGRLRGSKLCYHGDPQTRPMKDRVREAIFNLITTEARGTHAIDLFAGTGALGLEAISRGAVSGLLIEKHVPTARVLAENIASLGLTDCTTLLTTSAFLWAKRDLPQEAREKLLLSQRSPPPPAAIPWLIFCSPPYAFYIDQQPAMLELIAALQQQAPPGSILVAESDERFDIKLLPGGLRQEKRSPGWDVRTYAPAVVGVWRKPRGM